MRHTIKRYIHIVYLYSRYAIKETTRSSLGVVLFILGKLIRFGMFFVFIYYLVSQTSVLKGYTVDQALIILMTFELLTSFSGLFYREVFRFRSLLISGGLDGVLIKPFHPFTKLLIGGLDVLDATVLVIQIGVMGYLFNLGGYSFPQILLYILLFTNAFIIMTAFHIMALSVGLLTTTVDQILWILRDIVDAGRFPIEIYRQPLQWILTFVIPVGIMTTFPVRGLIGVVNVQNVIISTAVALLIIFLNLRLWNYAIKRYQSWGG